MSVRELRVELALARELLKVAICPECDGTLLVAESCHGYDGEEDVEVRPCRWHFERDQLLAGG